jgi:iron uptake system component EfeO
MSLFNPARKIRLLATAATCFLSTMALIPHGKAAAVNETAEKYRPYLLEGIGQALNGARMLQERVAANDLPGARKAWLSARAGWERSEVFTGGFFPDLDEKIDAWPNATTGFHAIEASLFEAGRTDVEADAKALTEHLAMMQAKVADVQLTPQGLLNGTAQLAFELGEGKLDGGESRISGTSLDDMRSNIDGIEAAYAIIFASAVEAADPALGHKAHDEIERIKAVLAVKGLKNVDADKLRELTEEFVVTLQKAAPKIGLEQPVLEASGK